MSNDNRKTVVELLAPMLKKTLFVAINRVAAPASAIEPFVAEHLAYMAKRKANRPIVQRLLQRPANQEVSIQ
jgi:hypothetical protein